MNTLPRPIGVCPATDGSKRTIYQDAAGKQFVLDNDNRVVFGDWLTPGRRTAATDDTQDGGGAMDGSK